VALEVLWRFVKNLAAAPAIAGASSVFSTP
jgi:hypothetical protein